MEGVLGNPIRAEYDTLFVLRRNKLKRQIKRKVNINILELTEELNALSPFLLIKSNAL